MLLLVLSVGVLVSCLVSVSLVETLDIAL